MQRKERLSHFTSNNLLLSIIKPSNIAVLKTNDHSKHGPRCFACLLIIRCTACCQRDVDVVPNSEDFVAHLSRFWQVAGRISLNRKQQRSITGAQTSLYDRLESWWSCDNNIDSTDKYKQVSWVSCLARHVRSATVTRNNASAIKLMGYIGKVG